MQSSSEPGAEFVWKNARLLERAIFEYYFRSGSPERIRSVLRLYQNEDGGFGHALEPDLRAPDSQPLFVEFGLRTLYECKVRDHEIAYGVCEFLAHHSDLEQGIPLLFPSSQLYPRAEHMSHAGNLLPAMDRLVGLVGLVNWQGVSHPWLPAAVEACLNYIDTSQNKDSHTILTSYCLLESVAQDKRVGALFDKLASLLKEADFFCWEAPVQSYGLTPLTFAPAPDSYCRRIFSDSQIEAHLNDLIAQQQPDGGWSIMWNPPSEMARCEWRAQRTVQALETLRAYGRI